ncbi:MAG: 1-deoxy-D-xylulose-5-phosphate reductoisomerase [Peptococcia bacterium]
MTKKIVILGSTGSIGRQALEVVDQHPEEYEIIGLAAGRNLTLLAEQIKKYRPAYVVIQEERGIKELRDLTPGCQYEISSGPLGLVDLADLRGIELILVAVTGIAGLEPTLKALSRGTMVALANKETLVTAGNLVISKAKENNSKILPVDSEHSAIFQCLEEHNHSVVDKLILTASGGPFLNYSQQEMSRVSPEMALQHPRWQMGPKITIDSAGLINKGLEVIEAHWLFAVPYEKIQVIIHPQSIIHSIVQYDDGSCLAQLGRPDMRVPIQYAFTYPKRQSNSFPKLDFSRCEDLTFEEPDFERFPGLRLAYEAGKRADSMPTVYNGANEVAVELFLQGRIGFMEIPRIIARVMERHVPVKLLDIETVLACDGWARQEARKNVPN